MKPSKNAYELIKEFEGCKLAAYRCPAGIWTIGFGHTGQDVYKGLTITQRQADKLLEKDAYVSGLWVDKLVTIKLNQNQYDSLVSFIFNLGPAQFRASTLRAKINRGASPEEIATQFMRWVFASGVKLKGLIKRREREAQLFMKNL